MVLSDHALEAQASIKVDMGERLLLLGGNCAAGNGPRDHNCVSKFFEAPPGKARSHRIVESVTLRK